MTKRTRRDRVESPLPSKLRISTPAPCFTKRVKDRPLPLDFSGLCEALRTPTRPWLVLELAAFLHLAGRDHGDRHRPMRKIIKQIAMHQGRRLQWNSLDTSPLMFHSR